MVINELIKVPTSVNVDENSEDKIETRYFANLQEERDTSVRNDWSEENDLFVNFWDRTECCAVRSKGMREELAILVKKGRLRMKGTTKNGFS